MKLYWLVREPRRSQMEKEQDDGADGERRERCGEEGEGRSKEQLKLMWKTWAC